MYCCLERHVHEAGFFVAITQKLQLTVNLVQLYEQGQDEGLTAAIQSAVEQVKDFDAEIVVLYMENKNIQLMLQQVIKFSNFTLLRMSFFPYAF